nr:hypothetical protein CFP56_30917 [Quercus suber]
MVRSFEDFLIHPTYVLPLERELPRRSFAPVPPASTTRRYSCSHILNFTMDHEHLAPDDVRFSLAKQSVESLATIKPFDNEPALARGYTSDEEAASPIDASDSSSLRSLSDGSSDVSMNERPAPAVAKAVQLSNRAQVVQLVSAGKVRVVSMPKVTESPKSTAPSRSSTLSSMTPSLQQADLPRHKREWSASSSKSSSPRESTSIRSSRPLSWIAPPLLERNLHVRQRRPSLPALMISSDSPGATFPMTPAPTARQPDFLRHDPFPTSSASPSALHLPTSHPSRRVMPTFLTKIIRRRESTRLEGVPELSSPSTPSTRPKMIARGADEIEPTIRLPPCPQDYAAEDCIFRSLPKNPVTVSTSAMVRPHKRARSVMI